jgi:hypothetical protein
MIDGPSISAAKHVEECGTKAINNTYTVATKIWTNCKSCQMQPGTASSHPLFHGAGVRVSLAALSATHSLNDKELQRNSSELQGTLGSWSHCVQQMDQGLGHRVAKSVAHTPRCQQTWGKEAGTVEEHGESQQAPSPPFTQPKPWKGVLAHWSA